MDGRSKGILNHFDELESLGVKEENITLECPGQYLFFILSIHFYEAFGISRLLSQFLLFLPLQSFSFSPLLLDSSYLFTIYGKSK